MNHWVHMEECHLVNMVPGLLMILAGKQASQRLRRERVSPTITPVHTLFYVLNDHSGLVPDYRSATVSAGLKCKDTQNTKLDMTPCT